MNYPTYLIHFNPNHDPKTGQFTFTKGQLSDENKRIYKAMKSGKKMDSFIGNKAIKQISNDKELLKARDDLKSRYEKYKKTGWPGGMDSASRNYSHIRYKIAKDFIGQYSGMKYMSNKKLGSFTNDWRDDIFLDLYESRIQSLIDFELGIDEALKYWLPDKSSNKKYDWDEP